MNNFELTKKELEESVRQYKEMITIQKDFIASIGAESKFDAFAKEVQRDQQTILKNAEALNRKEISEKTEQLSLTDQIAILERSIKAKIREYDNVQYPGDKFVMRTSSEKDQIKNNFIGQLEGMRQQLEVLKKQEALSKTNISKVEDVKERVAKLNQLIPELEERLLSRRMRADYADDARDEFREKLRLVYGDELNLESMKEELEELRKVLPPEKKRLFSSRKH